MSVGLYGTPETQEVVYRERRVPEQQEHKGASKRPVSKEEDEETRRKKRKQSRPKIYRRTHDTNDLLPSSRVELYGQPLGRAMSSREASAMGLCVGSTTQAREPQARVFTSKSCCGGENRVAPDP